jgi:hypothetical protein
MVLDLAIAKAIGGYAFGSVRVSRCDVLYLALEDNRRRLRSRLEINLGGGSEPPGLFFAIDAPRMDRGGDEWLRGKLRANPKIKFVVIDTLAKFRAPTTRKTGIYESDYQAISAIKAIGDEFGASILVVHHSRKAPNLDDPIDAISGSSGIAGSVDSILILKREASKAAATLYVRGRDIEEADFGLSQDPITMQWAIIGTAIEAKVSRERQRILDALREIQPATPKQIADYLGEDSRGAGAIRRLLPKLIDNGLIFKIEGKYCVSQSSSNHLITSGSNGNGRKSGNSGTSGNKVDVNTPVLAVTAVTADNTVGGSLPSLHDLHGKCETAGNGEPGRLAAGPAKCRGPMPNPAETSKDLVRSRS